MMSPGPEHDWPEAKRPSVRKSGAVSNIVETSDHCLYSGVHIGVLDKYKVPTTMQGERSEGGSRLSSSFPRQQWSHLSQIHSSPVVATAAGPSHQASPRRVEPAVDEFARAYRTTALRQLTGNGNGNSSRAYPRGHRQTIPSGGRSSALVSQPVLVRTYSGNMGEDIVAEGSRKQSAPPPPAAPASSSSPLRRSFPFLGGASSSSPSSGTTQERSPELPSDEEFSIDGILRAIEPNIQTTLNSIAEIYGRSKLSLANEYSSHIAPLGEIRAPPGYLLPVDEASSDQERQQADDYGDDGVVIYNDEQDYQNPFSYYGDIDNIRQAGVQGLRRPSMVPFSGDRSSVQAQPDTPRSSTETNLGFDSMLPELGAVPVMRDYASKPRSSGRALLGKNAQSTANSETGHIVTPAVVSEVHLDAQAENSQLLPEFRQQNQLETGYPGSTSSPSVLTELQTFVSWIAQAARGQPDSCQLRQSAEVQLRGMLDGHGLARAN